MTMQPQTAKARLRRLIQTALNNRCTSEQAGQDERYRGGTRGADDGQDEAERRQRDRQEVRCREQGGGHYCEACGAQSGAPQGVRLQQQARLCRVEQAAAFRLLGSAAAHEPLAAPEHHVVDADPARVEHQRVREQHHQDDRGAADLGKDVVRVQEDDVAADVVAEREVSAQGDAHEQDAGDRDGDVRDLEHAVDGVVVQLVDDRVHVAVAGVREDHDGERGHHGGERLGAHPADGTGVVVRESRDVEHKVRIHQAHHVDDGEQRHDGGVLQGVQVAQGDQGHGGSQGGDDPEQAFVADVDGDDGRHQVADQDDVAQADTEAADGDGDVEEQRERRVCDGADVEEVGVAVADELGRQAAQVQAEAGGDAGNGDDEDA